MKSKAQQQREPAAKSCELRLSETNAPKAGVPGSKGRGRADTSTALAAPQKEVTVTPAEHAIIKELREKQERRPTPPVKVATVDGKQQLAVDHPNAWVGGHLLMDAFGTTSVNFLDGLLQQLVPLCSCGEKTKEHWLNFMVASIKGIAPRDETEAMLAAQMAAVHNLTMVTAEQAMHARGPGLDLVSTRLNKFARTFATQVEALKKHRSGGEQTIKVQHVTVNGGGQAIVGNVTPGGSGAAAKLEVQSHAIAFAPGAALRSENETREAVPGAGDGEWPLPDARRQGGGAQGEPEQSEARTLYRKGD